MVYQRLYLAIHHVLTRVFTAFVRALFPPPAPQLAWSFRHLGIKSYNRL
jgi:hypothetical protein